MFFFSSPFNGHFQFSFRDSRNRFLIDPLFAFHFVLSRGRRKERTWKKNCQQCLFKKKKKYMRKKSRQKKKMWKIERERNFSYTHVLIKRNIFSVSAWKTNLKKTFSQEKRFCYFRTERITLSLFFFNHTPRNSFLNI